MKKLFAACVLLALRTLPLGANWRGDAGGSVATGMFRAAGAGQVEMQDEKLMISLYRDRAKVQSEYVLKNTGEAVDVAQASPVLERVQRRISVQKLRNISSHQMRKKSLIGPSRVM